MKLRYVTSVEDRVEDELCIDLVNGDLAPNWQSKNLQYYSLGSKNIPGNYGIKDYKTMLLNSWTTEDSDRAKEVRKTIRNAVTTDRPISLVTPSGHPTLYSDAFEDFLRWVESQR